jgi:hypothetical protein
MKHLNKNILMDKLHGFIVRWKDPINILHHDRARGELLAFHIQALV